MITMTHHLNNGVLMNVCKKYRNNDEYACHRCGYVWSVKDGNPVCLSNNQARIKKGKEAIARLKLLMSC